MIRRSPALRGVVLALVASALVADGLASVGCEDAYESPCQVERREVLVKDVTIGVRPSLVRARGRAIAAWPYIERFDAGVDGGLIGVSATMSAVEVAVVESTGALGLRTRVPVPDAFRLGLGSVSEAGIAVEDTAFLFYWIETETKTEPNGLVRTSAALKAAYIRDGVPSTVLAPAACERCTMTIAATTLGTESIAIVRTDPDVKGMPLETSTLPSFVALRFRRDGSIREEPAPWLGVPARKQDAGGLVGLTGAPKSELAIEVDPNGRVVVFSEDLAWSTDEALHLVAGPVVLPKAPDVRVSWDANGEASVLWSVSPFEDGRASAPASRDVFTGLVPAGGGGIATRERTSRGRTALALDRRGQEVGALFDATGRTMFAMLDPDGKKRGGDLLIATPVSGADEVSESHALFAQGNGRFTAITFGAGALGVREIRCGP